MFERNCLPFSKTFKKIHPYTNTPVNVTNFVMIFTNLMTFTILLDKTVYFAMGDLASSSIQFCYLCVVVLRLLNKEIDFKNCKFNLGRYSLIINYIAAIWLFYSMIVMLLPTEYLSNGGLNAMIFNWAPVLVILLIIVSVSYWEI